MDIYKPYQIISIDDHNILVIGVDYSRFENFAKEVKSDLQTQNFSGLIIIDMLLSNGNNKNRFFEINFNESGYDTTTLKCIDATPHILSFTSKFFHDNLELLNNGILSKNEILKIKSELEYP